MQLQKTKWLFQQYHYKIRLASVEPLCEVRADVSYLLLMKVGGETWLFTFRNRERPSGLRSPGGRPWLPPTPGLRCRFPVAH